jgi:hypothetical protein
MRRISFLFDNTVIDGELPAKDIDEIRNLLIAKGLTLYDKPDREPDAIVNHYHMYIKEGIAVYDHPASPKWKRVYQMFYDSKKGKLGFREVKTGIRTKRVTQYQSPDMVDAYKNAIADNTILKGDDIIPKNFGKIPPMR